MLRVLLQRSILACAVLGLTSTALALRADENTPGDPLPVVDEKSAKEDAISREIRSLLEDSDAPYLGARAGLSGNARTEPVGVADDSEEIRIRRVVKEYLLEMEQKKAALSKPVGDDGWRDVNSNLKMEATWKNGLEFENANKDFRVHVGGRTQFDMGWFNVNPDVQSDPTIVNKFRDGADFRRARLRVDGTMYEQIDWAAEYDFVNSALPPGGSVIAVPAPTDLWFTFTKLPYLGNLRVGNQKEPIGFEHLVSSRFLPFMERSFNQDAFYGGFNNGFTPGVQAFDTFGEETGTWAFGVFKPTTNPFSSNLTDGWALTGRLSYLPWYTDEGRGLLHVGIAARTAGAENGIRRYRSRYAERTGLSQNWPLIGDTGTINIDSDQMLNPEVAMVVGPFTLQAEYLFNWAQDAYRTNPGLAQNAMFHGGYVELMYFLTGEHRDYNRKTGVFDRVVPTENFFAVRTEEGNAFGSGAWQVGVRYNYLNLNDKGLNGGMIHDLTSGLNWFLNPNMKVQWNYSVSYRESPLAGHDGLIQGFGVRLAHDF